MYAPVNVSNPASRNHTAMLHPGQALRVSFTDATIMDECQAHVMSDFLELQREEYGQGGKTFVFSQTYDLDKWANISSVFLGQIYFTGRGQVNPAVSLYMASLNECKKDIVTAVNPDKHVIKLYPQQILEVVMYAPLWGQDLEWEYDTDDIVALELLSDNRIDPTVYKMSESLRPLNDAFFTYPRMLQQPSVSYLEYHWWFRWREMSANLAKNFQCPPVPLSFIGRVNGEIKVRHDFRVAINDRAKPGWQEARSFQVTFEDSAMDVSSGTGTEYDIPSFIIPELRSDHTGSHKRHNKRHHKNKNGRIGHAVGPHQHHGHRHATNDRKPYVKTFQARDVQIRLKPMASLEAGCKVVSDDPISSVPALPAPTKTSTETAGYAHWSKNRADCGPDSHAPLLRSSSGFLPPKAAYYYDGPDAQWD